MSSSSSSVSKASGIRGVGSEPGAILVGASMPASAVRHAASALCLSCFDSHEVVAVRRDVGQVDFGVGREQLPEEDRHQPAVEQNVVVGENERVVVTTESDHHAPEQRRPGEVEAADPVLLDEPFAFGGAFGLAHGRQIVVGPGHFDGLRYHLHRLAGGTVPETRTQIRVTRHQGLACGAEHCRVELPREVGDHLNGIDVRAFVVIHRMEQQAFLERCQGKDLCALRTGHYRSPRSLMPSSISAISSCVSDTMRSDGE